MKPSALIARGLSYYWRTNTAVVLGVAAAVAVLSGALLVGDSVRGSLSDLVSQRLGKTDLAVVSPGFFREELAEDLTRQTNFSNSFDAICPLIATEGVVTVQQDDGNGARAGRVRVYGVDDRFWRFHGREATGFGNRDAVLGAPLAEELNATDGATILVRVEHPSAVPLESLHARKDDRVRTLRATVKAVAPRNALGEFSLETSQGTVRALFLPLSLVQRELDMNGRVNTLLVSQKPTAARAQFETLTRMLRDTVRLEDLGLHVRAYDDRHEIVLDTDAGILDNARTNAAIQSALNDGLNPQPVFTYLANAIRIGNREIPYSLVTARPGVDSLGGSAPPIELNKWAADELHARVGDTVKMDYYVWEDPGRLVTQSAEFQLTRIVPLDPSDRSLAPVYPGITDSPTLDDWSPPFPIDLKRVRPIDEDYWKRYRTTPKAFIPLEIGQRLWRTRYGDTTSVRMRLLPDQPAAGTAETFAKNLATRLDPFALGLSARDVRAEGTVASRGATDFGLYFVYFSFFLVISALLVTALFFKLNVEQRAREVGLLRATGYGAGLIRRLFLGEGALLAMVGAVLGLIAGVGYAGLLMAALRTWWVGAVGTTALTLHVSPTSLAIGGLSGALAALLCVWITLRSLGRVSERRLLAGFVEPASDWAQTHRRTTRLRVVTTILGAAGAALVAAGAAGLIDKPGAFFGAGALLVAACLGGVTLAFRRPVRTPLMADPLHSRRAIYRLGWRNAAFRPARSVAAMAAIAAAAFILISVDAFRRSPAATSSVKSGSGGYALAVDLLIPLARDPSSVEGRKALSLEDASIGNIEPFRVRPGDDASCLNLYAPLNPRILAPQDGFLDSGRFAFRDSLARSSVESADPWLLLKREEADGAIPVIADANSIAYVLQRKLGDDIVITTGGSPVKLRLVAALDDSIFQGELLMSERNFLKLFPEEAGYGFLLAESGSASAIEEALQDFGADATPTENRLAAFHRVENTYISTFQTLGGLGLLLGTVGLGAVLLRSAAERRRELALLRAIGYKPADFFTMTLAENGLLLATGLAIGAACALVAIAPALMERGGQLPSPALIALLAATLIAGLFTALVATAAVLRSPLLSALRSE